MRTDDLVAALARSAQPVDERAVSRHFTRMHVIAVLLCVAAVMLLLGPRPDWREAVALPMFWTKLAFPATAMLASFALLRRLGYPGLRVGRTPFALAAPFALVWVMASAVLAAAAPSDRLRLVVGSSWLQCLLVIAALAVPALVLSFRAISGLAPTRPRLTGAIAGTFAGSAGAFAYAFSCVEMQAPFLAVWYSLGMLIPVAGGAWMGPRLLRW